MGDMLLGFDEIKQARGTHAHSLPACSQIIMHLVDNDISSKMTQGSMVDAGACTCHMSHVRQ